MFAGWGGVAMGLHQFINDAGRFFDQFGQQAEALGWRPYELFGLDPVAPTGRYDRMGLIWMLRGETVLGLTGTMARLSGGLAYRRKLSPVVNGEMNP